jgi:SagB-type dehydrogenase family enzyme
MSDHLIQQSREFLKDTIRQRIDFSATDQSRGIAPPPLQKPFAKDAVRINLLPSDKWQRIGQMDLLTAIRKRQSHRKFAD